MDCKECHKPLDKPYRYNFRYEHRGCYDPCHDPFVLEAGKLPAWIQEMRREDKKEC
jgi:hypothetical protein